MTSRVEAILGGAGFSETIEAREPKGEIDRGFATEVFDPEIDRWVRIYVNAVRRHFARLEGEVDTEGRVIFRSASPGPAREKRVVTEWLGPDRWRRTSSSSEDGGATWRLLFVDELERDAEAPADVEAAHTSPRA